MSDLDLEAIKARHEAATHVSAERAKWDASGPVVGYYHGGRWFGIAECHSFEGDPVDFDVAEFIAHARTDVPALVAEVERLRAYIGAILDHGATTWADSSCGTGGAGGQMITTTAHPEVVDHLCRSALYGRTLTEAADDYEAWVPGVSRLDQPAKASGRAGRDGRPV